MKSTVKNVARKATRSLLQDALFRRSHGDSFDVLEIAQFSAAIDSAKFYEEHMLTAQAFEDDLALLSHAYALAPPAGQILEFGVASGRTIRHLGSLTARPIVGFDSFEGLPEAWRTGFDRGRFAQKLPDVPAHVTLNAGWFTDTLPPYLQRHADPVALLHVDCDLYSSTIFLLDALEKRIVPGTVIVFDEYFNYPGWRQHEYKAFEEFVARTGLTYSFDSFVPSHQQVCVVIT